MFDFLKPKTRISYIGKGYRTCNGKKEIYDMDTYLMRANEQGNIIVEGKIISKDSDDRYIRCTKENGEKTYIKETTAKKIGMI